MVLVLVVLGLLYGLVAPRIGGRIDEVRERQELRDIEGQLQQLARRVRLSGRSLELPRDLSKNDLGDGSPPLILPSGWAIQFDPPWRIAENGACSSALIKLELPRDSVGGRNYSVKEPTCELAAR